MYNSVLLIGRTTDKPNLKTLESGIVVGNFTLAVARPFKNADGEIETDFINCTMWNSIASSAYEYVKKGSLICVKGILQTKEEVISCVNDDGVIYKRKFKYLDVYVEKVIYLKL